MALWHLNGVKSFGCATGIADQYLVAASLEGIDDASGLCSFLVDRDAPGTRGRIKWDALGMRGTATEGLVLEDVFVADENALAIPGSFARMCTQNRSGYVGNQVAASSIYLGGTFAVYHAAMKNMIERKFEDTGRPLGSGPYQQQLIGEMYADLHTALLWARRMIDIETAEPPILTREEVMPFWRTCKGQVAEHSFKVTQHALKLAGTSGTLFETPFSRALRDVAMGLVREANEESTLPGPYGDVLLQRLPLGVAAVIVPWNAPSGIACHKLASALAAGCPTILKPSEWAPASAQVIAETLVEAGLPEGVFQILHGGGDTGGMLVTDERTAAVSFTGGLQGGRAVAHACAEGIKPAQLELGGNNPMLVLEDAKLDAAADGVVAALTTLNGQWCRALGRLLVHRSLQAELLQRVAQKMEKLSIGSSMSPDSTMGPLVHAAHRRHVQEAVQRYGAMGAAVISYGELPELDGWFFAPTLVTGLKPELTLEEIFGPVARGIRTGGTKINGVSMLNLNPQAPRPAWGLSGLGDEGTRETFEFFRGSRLIGVAGR